METQENKETWKISPFNGTFKNFKCKQTREVNSVTWQTVPYIDNTC